ncbi:MAG TPA: hypothetical protein VGX21_21475, partial [Methylomirabilota bacterium]|nr:hypothetical protein [Methylomirabilota bacterium]
AFYTGRPVAVVDSEAELMRALAGPPRGVAVVRDDALERVRERARLVVLMRDRLGGRAVTVVTLGAVR